MNTWWAGQVGRLEFLPTLRASKALGAYEVGFCPTAWPERTFSFKADPTGGLDQCVMEPGRPGWLLKYAWYPMWSRGTNVDGAHQSAGEYLYLGPGTNGAYWNWEGVSPRLSREFGTLIGGADSINKWTGVHYGGRVMHERNLVHVRNQWSRKRVPLMGESAQSVVGGNPTEMAAFNAAPHMPKWRLRNDWSKNGGNLNYLFNDGSVETYPYSF